MTGANGCCDWCNMVAFGAVLLPYSDDELGLRCTGANKEQWNKV